MFPRAQEYKDLPSASRMPWRNLQVHQARHLSHLRHFDWGSNDSSLGPDQWNHGVRFGLVVSAGAKADNHVDLRAHSSRHRATAGHIYSPG